MTRKFNVICIGTGPAASTVATTCAIQGMSVAIVESREFGGTCALHGCNPKKVFTNAAALIDQFLRARGKLVRGKEVGLEWKDLIAYQHRFTDPVRDETEDKFRDRRIDTFHGSARFVNEKAIVVGESVLDFDNLFIGVGAKPVPLEISGADYVTFSDTFMELPSLPREILFLGGGFISFEFAHVAVRAGSRVTIVDRNVIPLQSFDPDLVELLLKCSSEAGINVLRNAEATSVVYNGGRLEVTLRSSEGERLLNTDMVVHGGGRVPNVKGMQLETGRVEYGERGIKVNAFFQSVSNLAVYAAGDCADAGLPMLTPTANRAAQIAANKILATFSGRSKDTNSANRERQPNPESELGPVVQVVFTVPPLAAVGLSEEAARRQGLDLDVRFEDLSTKGEVRKLCVAVAGCKLLIDRRTDQILGAHLLGPHAEEIVNLFALAIRHRLTTASVKSTLFAYPTMAAEFCQLL